MTHFKKGDKIRSRVPQPIGEVVHITDDGIPIVEWPSGIRAPLTGPDSIEKVEDQEARKEAINNRLAVLRKVDDSLVKQLEQVIKQKDRVLEEIIRGLL